MAPTGTVTEINAEYLNQLKAQLQTVLDQVNTLLKGVPTSGVDTTGLVVTIDNTLHVLAGANNFNAGVNLNKALNTLGGSINDQLTWLKKVLTDMINEIDTTVQSFSGTESLNTETVDQLLQDFQSTINDMNNPPGSGKK